MCEAVQRCFQTRDHPVLEVRDKARAELEWQLEVFVRERLEDERLAASLDGLQSRLFLSDDTTLKLNGAFWTLGMNAPGSTADPMLPMEAELSLNPGAVSVVRVAGRAGLIAAPGSEREFQRALNKAVWHHSFELYLSRDCMSRSSDRLRSSSEGPSTGAAHDTRRCF